MNDVVFRTAQTRTAQSANIGQRLAAAVAGRVYMLLIIPGVLITATAVLCVVRVRMSGSGHPHISAR